MRTDGSDGRPKMGGWTEFDIGRPPPRGLDWDRQPDGLTIFIRSNRRFKYVVLGAMLTLPVGILTIILMLGSSGDELYEFLFWDLTGNVLFPIITLGLTLMTLWFVWWYRHKGCINVTREHLRLFIETPSGKIKDEITLPVVGVKEVRIVTPTSIQTSHCLKIVTANRTYHIAHNLSPGSLDWLMNCVVEAIKMATDGAEVGYPDKLSMESSKVEREGKRRREMVENIILSMILWLGFVLYGLWETEFSLEAAVIWGLAVLPLCVLGFLCVHFFPGRS